MDKNLRFFFCDKMAATVFVLTVFILGNVLATDNDTVNDNPYKPEHCIKMTQKKEAEIQLIIKQIGDFLNDLSERYDHYDIRMIKFDIEEHSDNEVEEKETVLEVTINDCDLTEEEKQEEEKKEKEKEKAKEKKETEAEEVTEIIETVTETTVESAVPEVYKLELEKTGQDLLKVLEKRRGPMNPLVVYIQELFGRNEYIFPPQ